MNKKEQIEIQMMELDMLVDFKNHPYKVKKDRELYELMESIKREGILVPIIVRPIINSNKYEIVSGHRRRMAASCAGLTKVPVIIKKLSDDEAVLYMVDSNLSREHILPSEKSYAYKMKLAAMKHQGKSATSGQVAPKLKNGKTSRSILADEVGESERQIQRYIRLTNLIPKILDMVDAGRIALTPAVELSYLSEEEQYELYAVMDIEGITPSLSQANRMRIKSSQGKLDMNMIYMILDELKPNQREQIKIRADIFDGLIPNDYTPKQKTDLIISLVTEWAKKQK